ncbi:hypothetical protein [Lentzea pudingi]|uniref:hypothetical protein n=1 Tax=Lentzea pudingi TaxID=1789439 RepID=UPI00166E26C0|nr:hypothetical protein [Lentzea pudingi]
MVRFAGEDGRTRAFSVGGLPLPGWHRSLASAFTVVVGPTGPRRTLASANSVWAALKRFVRFLAALPSPPAAPQQLTAAHVDAFLRTRIRAVGAASASTEFSAVRVTLRRAPLCDQVPADVADYLARRQAKYKQPVTVGYSAGEWMRLSSVARADVAAVRDRITAGDHLVEAWSTNRALLTGQDAVVADQCVRMASTGRVPRIPHAGRGERAARCVLAGRLFVTAADQAPLLVLLAAVTGRNPETLKELPAEHRILDGAAVEVRLVKRRRGPHRWFDTATWEIGPPHRELHTPGGLYLLLHRLMARGRTFSGSQTIWSVWRNPRHGLGGPDEHHDPFAAHLAAAVNLTGWARGHDLRADLSSDPEFAEPLQVRLNRIRTTVEVRRTQLVGGHLPSAARSNTMNVLFANYLRGDPTAQAWAEEVVSEALIDAEQAALSTHRQALQQTGAMGLRINSKPDVTDASGNACDGAWTACADPEQHPATGRPCRRVSFLDCFHCGNCLVTPDHLPAILALLDVLSDRRAELGQADWWARYGPAWAAIRHDVLPRFTPAQLQAAAAARPADALLDLAENPWERP